jgi:hypothetical protein
MSAFAQKAEAQRKYTELSRALGYKPSNVNTKKMNAKQINDAYDALLNQPKSDKPAVKYPLRYITLRELKKHNVAVPNYKTTTAKTLYEMLQEHHIKIATTMEPKVIQPKILNPITGTKMSQRGIQMYLKLGYTLANGKLSYEMPKKVIGEIVSKEGNIVYTITKKDVGTYKTGLISYNVIDVEDNTVIYHGVKGFSVSKRSSATANVNELLYENEDTYGDACKTVIESVELYKPKFTDKMIHGLAYRINLDEDPNDYDFDDSERYVKHTKNCVITALENHLKRKLPEMHKKYADGVAEEHYDEIAKALNIVIRVKIMNVFKTYNASRKKGIIDLIYLNNHVVAKYSGDDREIVKHKTLDNATISNIFREDDVHDITNIIKLGSDVMCIDTLSKRHQLSHQTIKSKNVKTLIEINSDALTATTEYKKLFIEKNHIRRIDASYEDAKHFARHGIKVLKCDFMKGNTIDLKGAYTNFMNYPCYEGIPYDITFWISGDADINVITSKYAGFGLVSGWKNYYTGDLETRWAPIPLIKSRLSKGHQFKVERWALAFAKGDLDLSMFKGMHKRLWHLCIGSMSRCEFGESEATTDPVLAESIGAFKFGEINGTDVYVATKDPEACSTYVHVSAYIQGYVEIMMEDKFDQMRKDDVNWWAVYVDGISTDGNVDKYVDEFWASKPNVEFNAPSFDADDHMERDYIDMSYIEAPIICGFDDIENDIEQKKQYDEYWKIRKFVDIHAQGSNRFKIIEGPAGSGKSTMIKAIYKTCDAIILTPNNSQKEQFAGMRCETIDMYLTLMRVGNGKLKKYPFVLIDEYTHMNPDKLKHFESALMFGNCAQLKIGDYLDYKQYDHHVLTTVYRCDKELEDVANEAKGGDISKFPRIELKEALKNGYTILAGTHRIIEKINNIGLSMDLPRIIRFTKTNLKKNIFAGDMGILKNGLCISNRTGLSHKMKVGRDPKKDLVVYGYARTYHATQGAEMEKVVLCTDCITNWDMIYTGATRVHHLENAMITSLVEACKFEDCKYKNVKHEHVCDGEDDDNFVCIGWTRIANWRKSNAMQ